MTPSGADGGADILAETGAGSKTLIQCKHRSQGKKGLVDETVVGELVAARAHYGAKRGSVLAAVTNGRFTLAAQRAAVEKDVRLLERADLGNLSRIVATGNREC